MFGWIPALWKITEQQVLASAGLDAFVVWMVLIVHDVRSLIANGLSSFFVSSEWP